MFRTKTRTKLIGIISILIILLLILNFDTFLILISGDPDALKELSHGSVVMILLITFILMLIQNTFPIIPLLLLISLNVSLFGLTVGYIWSWFISIVGACFAFMLTRYWLQSLFHKYVNDKYKRKIEEHGFWFVMIGRLLPFMPSSIVNIAAGGSSVRFTNFILASTIGNTVYYLVIFLISEGLLSLEWEKWF